MLPRHRRHAGAQVVFANGILRPPEQRGGSAGNYLRVGPVADRQQPGGVAQDRGAVRIGQSGRFGEGRDWLHHDQFLSLSSCGAWYTPSRTLVMTRPPSPAVSFARASVTDRMLNGFSRPQPVVTSSFTHLMTSPRSIGFPESASTCHTASAQRRPSGASSAGGSGAEEGTGTPWPPIARSMSSRNRSSSTGTAGTRRRIAFGTRSERIGASGRLSGPAA